jgi:hypothetical protein
MVNYVAGHFASGSFAVLDRMKLTLDGTVSGTILYRIRQIFVLKKSREFSLHCLLVQKKEFGEQL